MLETRSSTIMGAVDRLLAERLRDVAVIVAMPDLGDLSAAVMLAEDLVAAGPTGPATLEVAGLTRNVLRRDGEALVRDMLSEHGIVVPNELDEAGRYDLLLYAFAFLHLPYEMFEGPFYARLTSSDLQSELDGALVRMMVNEMDMASDTRERADIQERMRETVRVHLDS